MPVVATTSILADLARQVGGDRVAVRSLVAAGSDIHDFAPSPSDVTTVASARVVVANGLGLEGWIDRLVEESGFKGATVRAGEHVETLPVGGAGSVADPHAWLDARNAAAYAGAIAEAFAQADPAGADDYRAWSQLYAGQLRQVDAWVRRELADLPAERRRIVTDHDSLRYYARAYGLEVLPVGGHDGEHEHAPADLAELIAQLRATKVQALFLEHGGDGKTLERIASEAGVRVGGTLLTDTLAPAGEPGDTYIGMQMLNARVLVRALR